VVLELLADIDFLDGSHGEFLHNKSKVMVYVIVVQ
jgi:hypothetical protein